MAQGAFPLGVAKDKVRGDERIFDSRRSDR